MHAEEVPRPMEKEKRYVIKLMIGKKRIYVIKLLIQTKHWLNYYQGGWR